MTSLFSSHKPKGHPLIGVETQASKYSGALPPAVPAYKSPLPFAYESTGTVTQFTNLLEPDARTREVFTFHRPEELLRLVSLDAQVRGKLKALPTLDSSKVWSVQKRAIEILEQSLAKNNPRSLIQMATGSGKTFTAVNACYRLIKFGGARRILFLVDRSNLGRQTYREFQQFVSPVNAYKFTDEYHVQLLNSNTVAPTSKVVITTIQGLDGLISQAEAHLDRLNDRLEQRLLELERERHCTIADIVHIGRAWVLPHPERATPRLAPIVEDADIERIAVEIVIRHEESRGWQVESVEAKNRGFDLISRRPHPEDPRTAIEVRFIEVKGRAGVGQIGLTANEYKTAQRLKGDYWLYTVFNCGSQPELHLVQDPARLGWEAVVQVEHYQIAPGKILAARSEQLTVNPGSSWSLKSPPASPRSKKFEF